MGPIGLLIFTFLSINVSANLNSTLKGRINLAAFEFFSRTAHHVVDEEIPKIKIPEVTIDITGGPGTGRVTATDMTIKKFQSPKFDFHLLDSGILWESRDGTIKIKGKWAAKYTLLVPLSESGWIDALVSGIRIRLSAGVFSVDKKPQIFIENCVVNIDHLDIEIGGGVLPWIVNLFRADISSEIRFIIHKQACDSARSILLAKANEFLHLLPSHVAIGNNFYLDYALLGNPTFTRNYIESELSADIVYGNISCFPISIEEWKDSGSNQRMMTLWMSESVPNCLLSSSHQGQLVKFTVTKDIPQLTSYLRTSCSLVSICIGRFFSKLKVDFPNRYIDLHFHTYKSPAVHFHKDDIKINSTFAVDFHINPKRDNPEALARLVLECSSSVKPLLKGNRLVGVLNETEIVVREDFSEIGNMSTTFLSMFEKVFRLTTQVLVESVLHKGVPLPVFDNVTISNSSEIHIMEKYIRFNIDFDFE